MPKLETSGISLHYEVSGSGPPLLLIAGFMSDSASWAPLLPLLEPHFTVVRPDNRSTGRTTPWDAPCSLDVWATDALALLDHLSFERAHVHGHSLGGLIAWHLSQKAPERIESLVIGATAPCSIARNEALFRAILQVRMSDAPPDTWLRLLFPWLFAPEVFEAHSAIEDAVAGSLAYPHAQTAKEMQHQMQALFAIDAAMFEPPSVHTRVLLGSDDLLIPMQIAKGAMPYLEPHILKAGHSLHWDAPSDVAQHILSHAGVAE
jgi:pimeloyl-ACP methyl ester carboxylesterase